MRIPSHVFYFIFFLSGFSALIYESIWAHYLKLFLGHAAYAQTLVLAIFMGGMALGSAVSAKYSHKWKNLLLGYAIVEGVIGFFALLFHDVFLGVTELVFTTLIPMFNESPLLVILLKWGLSTMIILPQSILLGMTFPLMVAGILRRYPEATGRPISTLYFVNSFGASIGVLVSAFVLIEAFGLPGTIFTAGLINIFLALTVWALTKEDCFPAKEVHTQAAASASPANDHSTGAVMLLVIALFTGLSSFMYEIAWIRMLSLVLGGSTHSFELMLAAFILGIALGGFWLRKRIDHINNPRQFLGYIQLAMGIFAIFSIFLYHYSFDLMQFVLETIQRKESTYGVYLAISGFICLIMMLPATFCAGMTLPLITKMMTTTHYGERGIGAIYASNTCGAIAGIFLSIHLVMPLLGLKSLITIGAGIDLLLGAALLGVFVKDNWKMKYSRPQTVAISSFVLFGIGVAVFDMDKVRLSSGVYRDGKAVEPIDVIFYKDGKTSSVSVYEIGNTLSIANNGKPDASVSLDITRPTADESTQNLLALLPLLHRPEAINAAVIGLGSGETPNALLASNKLERVDSIEIEPAIVEGSKLFKHRVDRINNDARSHVYIDDAKTFFSTRNYKYDIIVSEPPNPWVSGVSSLFTQEFYHRTKSYMNDDAVFVQWLHLYEIDTSLAATIFNAISEEFSDYVVYRSDLKYDAIIVATKQGKVPDLSEEMLVKPSITSELSVFGIHSVNDIKLHRLISKPRLDPYLKNINKGINSDYFPLLDNDAAKLRFSEAVANEFVDLVSYPVPIYKLLSGDDFETSSLSSTFRYEVSAKVYMAQMLMKGMLSNGFKDSNLDNLADQRWKEVATFKQVLHECKKEYDSLIIKLLHSYASNLLPYLNEEGLVDVWKKIADYPCVAQSGDSSLIGNWVTMYQAISARDYGGMLRTAEIILDSGVKISEDEVEIVLITALLGSMHLDNSDPKLIWKKWESRYKYSPDDAMIFMLSQIGI